MAPVNILIVDDREENIIALEALLHRDDIRKFSTTSPNEALKIAWENQIAIALVDVQMPEMDGFELVEMLKSNPKTRDILVIFVTAISKEAKYAVKGFGAGAVDYLYKPLDPYITAAKVDAFIQLARSQAEIREKNIELQNFAVVVKNSADIICAVEAQTLRITSVNPAVEKILGFRPNEVVGKSIVDMAVEDDRAHFRKKLGEVIKDNLQFSVFEYRFETFDRRAIWAECRVTYRNKVIFMNISDVSPQKSFQEQLIKSKEAAEYGKKVKETFLANMSHELRTPVNGIIGLTALLRKTETNEQQDGMLDLLETSSQSLLAVINDVLDISKIEAGKFNIVRTVSNIRTTVRSVHDLLRFKAEEHDIEFLLEIAEDVPEYIMMDTLRMNQILMNLLSNAIKFTEKGYVKLKVTQLQKHGARVKLKFSVEDTGIGIPADRLAKIFDSFEQAEDDTTSKYGGTGLGLTITKSLIELKGGDLTVSSQPGKGSVFNFTNWYDIAAAPEKKVEPRDKNKALPLFDDVTILVAEDNLVNQFMLTKILKEWNIQVEIVDNGRKALEKLKELDFDMILMDTHMPEMSGYQTAKAIRMDMEEPKRSIPIISLSAASYDHEQQQALTAGMNDVLPKPFMPYELHEKIEKLLAGKKSFVTA
ncbi:hybrid sensor histidine kinase/response regulator [Mucilaginibacter myungsuensis]|uniref:Sensory/regulatory protein RpfC n=1 Tax=Mucilaginibacter myungsuensis TaxID=649104 RepID=A0A929KW11_9SPHI|nr:response regulator [Mucilaginibacter myungsuensis]MBE9660938.1 response regulator [Mucilaginibacter myungsuensis]MDN3600984.1 response regulator [Mucilaginibacter myungsuensis]